MKKVKMILVIAATIALFGITITGAVFSINSYNLTKESIEEAEKREKEEREKTEDTENILIAGEYQIVSTKNISDAYKSGDTSSLSDEDKTTLEVASKILDEIITEDMSSYDKEKAIYDWICDNVSHDTYGTVAVMEARDVVDRPYGVLQNKQAVCVGYATSFRLLANMAGLECMVMHDTGEGHSWNLVKLDDNSWYIVDCYFDAYDGGAKYMHFNMNDKIAYEDHDWDRSLFPSANGTEYCYVYMNKENVGDPMKALDKLVEAYETEVETAIYEVNTPSEKEIYELSYIVEGLEERSYNDDAYFSVSIMESDVDDKMIVRYYRYLETEDMPIFDEYDIDYEKIDQVLDNIFGEPINWDEKWDEDWDEDFEEYCVENKDFIY